MDPRRLRARFSAAWRRLGGRRSARRFDDLWRRYREPHRRYHTLAHVQECLADLDAIRAAEPSLLREGRWAAVEVALWFHDAIYAPGAADNEDRSAALLEAAARHRLRPPTVAEIRRLILGTKAHAPTRDAALRVLLDCDLAPLGRRRGTFRRDSEAIRLEQGASADDRYRAARRAGLEAWSRRSMLFQLRFMRRRYEAQARANLAAAIEQGEG
jgi:predicted metal-dependent HD superfamily phosphohydrolase